MRNEHRNARGAVSFPRPRGFPALRLEPWLIHGSNERKVKKKYQTHPPKSPRHKEAKAAVLKAAKRRGLAGANSSAAPLPAARTTIYRGGSIMPAAQTTRTRHQKGGYFVFVWRVLT